MKMDNSNFYEIRVNGHLSDRWSDWFDGLAIRNDREGETILSGSFVDQASLFGTLNKILALNLTLLSLNRLAPEQDGSIGDGCNLVKNPILRNL
jgi:hypothetical protein